LVFKKWQIGKPDRELAKALAEEFDLDPFTVLLACTRGITDPMELECFLSDEIILADHSELNDIYVAADCINEAIESNKKIAIYGDYDCDGVSATAIMYKYLKKRNADIVVRIPNRLTDGYGMNNDAIDELKSKGVELIITVDNGIACKNEVEYAKSLGISTVITDHHLPPEELPDAVAVVDPHRIDSNCSFKDICGAFVAFKVVCAIAGKEPEEMIMEYADLIAIATIGDVMPLVYENRSVVKLGVNLIRNSKSIGLTAILMLAEIDRKNIDSQKIAYGIVPRINAAGRMGSADRAFSLLIENNMLNAISIANEIDRENTARKNAEKEIFEDSVYLIEKYGYKHDKVIVVCGNNFHPGVLGIVAAKICEKYGKPTFILNCEEEQSYGSGRSISGLNLYDALNSCSDCLVKFGGHELAAGVTVLNENVDIFRKSINDYADNLEKIIPEIKIDFCINPKVMSLDMVSAIKDLEPFGNSNPAPLFGILNSKIEHIASLSDGRHIKITLSKGDVFFKGLLFNVSLNTFPFKVGDIVDIAVSLDTNLYKGETYLSVIIKAIRPSGIDQDKLFNDIYAVEDYLQSGNVTDTLQSLNRESIGSIYKFINKGETTIDKIIYEFVNSIGYAVTYLSVKVLLELNLISENSGIITVTNKNKTELINSNTYCTITNGGETN